MKTALAKSNLLSCSHAEMLVEIVDVLTKSNVKKEDFNVHAGEFLRFISQRIENKEKLHSYQLFIMSKFKSAFDMTIEYGIYNRGVILDEDDLVEGTMSIRPEEFEDAKIDEDFDKIIGYK